MNIYLKAFLGLLVVAFFSVSLTSKADDLDLENTLYLDLIYGRVVIKMFPDVAPNHVSKIKKLTRDGYYDGSIFHQSKFLIISSVIFLASANNIKVLSL